ncbi:importin beta like ARM repeat alpha superhelix [Cryptosporidium xiaoi]|uniref:Importin beta like ARM repeat alpha superhelix n=1 Tax=Cryptosporidium xiaoi TaxID=659607 RepID=A0AAV9Y197_9CRYT
MSSTQWKSDVIRCQDVLNILKQADSPDSNVQLQVTNALNSFVNSSNDASCYFALIFSELNNEGVDVRQRAGLLLKNYLLQYGIPNSPEQLEYIKRASLTALNDSQKLIRSTAGTIVTNFVNMKQGKPFLVEFLHYLSQLVDMATHDSIDGAFDCLYKICEDELEFCLGENSTVSFESKQRLGSFIEVSKQIILPKLFTICQGLHQVLSSNEAAVYYSLKCITLYAQHHLFTKNQPLNDLFNSYWQIIGIMAKQESKRIRILVVIGIITIIEDDPDAIIDSSGVSVIIEFILCCCEDNNADSYNLRLESLEFWPIYLRNEKGANYLRPFLPRLLICLLDNAIFTDFDYIEMDPSHFEDKVEDDQHSMGPRFHQGRGSNGDDDDEVEIGAWGNQWTVRKASALALDHISVVFGNEILKDLLPLIENRLQNQDWEKQESAVLALGAIARGCLGGLSPFLPKVLNYLFRLTNDSKPLIRSISCWCISRFAPWLAHQQGQPILSDAVRALLTRVLDPNKRVEEAACSATATFIEDSTQSLSLIPFLDEIIETISRALVTYQYRNLLILCDTISTLCFSIGPSVYNQKFENNLIPLLIEKWKTFPIEHPCLIGSMDAISKIFTVIGPGVSKFAEPVLEHCISNNLYSAVSLTKDADDSCNGIPEVIECALDLVSSIVESIRFESIPVLKRCNFLGYIQLFSRYDRFPNVKQSVFACLGDLAKYGGDDMNIIKPVFSEILQITIININDTNIGISNNAAWALGEMIAHSSSETRPCIEQLLDPILDTLISRIPVNNDTNTQTNNLAINICITLGRTSALFPEKSNPKISFCLGQIFEILSTVRNDAEKMSAIQGICFAIKIKPTIVDASNIKQMLDLISSLQSVLSPKSNYFELISPLLRSTIQSIYLNSNKEIFAKALHSQNDFVQGILYSYLSTNT